MATCMKYYYPERYQESCKHMVTSNGDCRVLTPGYCVFQMNTTQAEHAILDNLRIVKEQNAEILAYIRGHRKMK